MSNFEETQVSPEKVERDVLAWVASLHDLNVLQEVCASIDLEIPNTVDTVNSVLKLLFKTLELPGIG